MARSQLLIDLVSGKSSLESILLRLKVVLSDLENESISKWVSGELQGFEIDEVPSYRILKGNPTGTFIVNYRTKYTNSNVPLKSLVPDEIIEKIITLEITDSITAIENMLNGDQKDNIAKPISTDFCHSISTELLQIAGMHVKFSSNQLDGIISNVKSKLVEIIMQLELSFDDLDNLDIRSQLEEKTIDKNQVVYNIQNIIFDDSITLGDKNKLKKASLGHLLGKKKNN